MAISKGLEMSLSLIVVSDDILDGVPAKAQTYAVQNQQGQVTAYIQQNGNTVNVLTPSVNSVSQQYTVYPNQIVTPYGSAIGIPSYTVPMTPPSPPSPRVMQ